MRLVVPYRLLENLILICVDHHMCSRICVNSQLNRFLIGCTMDTRDSSHESYLSAGLSSYMFDFYGQAEHPAFPALNKTVLVIRIFSLQMYSISFFPVVADFVS